jgi:hypothetical protein
LIRPVELVIAKPLHPIVHPEAQVLPDLGPAPLGVFPREFPESWLANAEPRLDPEPRGVEAPLVLIEPVELSMAGDDDLDSAPPGLVRVGALLGRRRRRGRQDEDSTEQGTAGSHADSWN